MIWHAILQEYGVISPVLRASTSPASFESQVDLALLSRAVPSVNKMGTKPQLTGEGFNSIAGMSKSQLYDLMSQMKLLIEQNHQQAKQILIDNPMLTKALFQAQIMLGMVKPTQPASIQQVLSQSQRTQVDQKSNIQTTQSLPVEPGHQGQTNSSQPSVSVRRHHPPQPSISMPPAALPPLNLQSQTAQSIPPHSVQQPKEPANTQVTLITVPESSQVHNLPLPPPPAPPHYSNFQPHMTNVSSQSQPSLQIPGIFNQPVQPPPFPQQPRPPLQPFSHQLHSQMPHNLGFQPGSGPQHYLSQPMFHPGSNIGSSFPQGQPPLPSHPPPRHLYQGGPHLGLEYNNQVGPSMQSERGPHWAPGLPERGASGHHLPVPPPMATGQMGQSLGSGQPHRPAPLTPEMEKALVQQVMSLTPEQINLLPPEQRQQVIQLQEMLR